MSLFFVILIVCIFFCSCASRKSLVSDNVRQDSVDVNVRTEIIYVPDTIYIEIPAQKAERTTKDSTSHLENDFAKSDARINPDGTLSHSLETKPQQKPVEFQKPVERKDSIVYRVRKEKVVETVEVERKPSWWEETRKYGFYILLLLTLWRYRKKIWIVITAIFV